MQALLTLIITSAFIIVTSRYIYRKIRKWWYLESSSKC